MPPCLDSLPSSAVSILFGDALSSLQWTHNTPLHAEQNTISAHNYAKMQHDETDPSMNAT